MSSVEEVLVRRALLPRGARASEEAEREARKALADKLSAEAKARFAAEEAAARSAEREAARLTEERTVLQAPPAAPEGPLSGPADL